MARQRTTLTEEETRELLAGPHKMQIATHNPDGTIHLVTMYYAMVDGLPAFWTYATSQKAVNPRRDPRLTALVETGDGYGDLRGISFTGRVEIIEDFDRVFAIGQQIYGRYVDFALEGPVLDYVEHQARKRLVFLVHADRTVSWDHRKLGVSV